jgi:hypothetical protein
LHVEEVIVKTLMAGRVGLHALRAVPEKAQRREGPRRGSRARHEASFDTDRITGQGKSGGSDAGGPVRSGLVDDQTIDRIRFVQEVVERLALQRFQSDFDRRRGGVYSSSQNTITEEIRQTTSVCS